MQVKREIDTIRFMAIALEFVYMSYLINPVIGVPSCKYIP